MNRTKDELLLDCKKQFEHIEDVLGYNRLSTTRSLIDEINQALTIPAVISAKRKCACGSTQVYTKPSGLVLCHGCDSLK